MARIVLIFLIMSIALGLGQTYTLRDSTYTTFASANLVLGLTGRNYSAHLVKITADYNIGKVAVHAEKVSGDNPVMNFVAQIWSHNSTGVLPNAQIGSNSNIVNASTFPAYDSPDWVEFTFSTGISVNAGDTIWVCLYTATPAADYCYWEYFNVNYGKSVYSANGSSWTTLDVDDSGNTRIYSVEVETEQKTGFSKYSGFSSFKR